MTLNGTADRYSFTLDDSRVVEVRLTRAYKSINTLQKMCHENDSSREEQFDSKRQSCGRMGVTGLTPWKMGHENDSPHENHLCVYIYLKVFTIVVFTC